MLNRRRVRPRLARRARNRKRPDLLRGLLNLALIGLGAEILYVAFNSPLLAVRHVRIVGVKSLRAEQIRSLMGLPVGENIFRTNLYRARLAVQKEPAVHRVKITRLLPDTIVVTVHERTPAFTLAVGGRLLEVDAHGMIYRSLARPLPKLPVLSVAGGIASGIGQMIPPELLASAHECVRLARAADLWLTKISVDAHRDLWLNIGVSGAGSPLAKPLRVRLGRPEGLPSKFADAQHVLRGAPQVTDLAAYLDVSCAGRPAFMAQSSTGTEGRL